MQLYVNRSVSSDCTTNNEKKALAKRIVRDDKTDLFYIKCYAYDKTFVNPTDPNSHGMRLTSARTDDKYLWTYVNETVFNKYLAFLKNEKEITLKEAERLRLDG